MGFKDTAVLAMEGMDSRPCEGMLEGCLRGLSPIIGDWEVDFRLVGLLQATDSVLEEYQELAKSSAATEGMLSSP